MYFYTNKSWENLSPEIWTTRNVKENSMDWKEISDGIIFTWKNEMPEIVNVWENIKDIKSY